MKNQEAAVAKFKDGNIYEMRFICDSDLKVKFICLKRTEKTVTFQRFQSTEKPMTRKVRVYRDSEYIKSGSYSMAPSIYADRVVG